MNTFLQKFGFLLGIITLRYFLIAGIAFAVCYVIWKGIFEPARIQSRRAVRTDFRREILNSTVMVVVIAVFVGVVFLTPLRGYTLIYSHTNDYPLWYLPFSLLVTLVIHDTYFYWMHRALHHPRIYRYVHRVHHLTITPSPFASYSFHLLESFSETAIVYVLVFTLPLHIYTLMAFGWVSFLINVYGHLGYEIAPKGFRRSWAFEWLATSVYHNLHHSHFTGNYGLYFRFWDKAMHTENPDYVATYDTLQSKRFGSALVGLDTKQPYIA